MSFGNIFLKDGPRAGSELGSFSFDYVIVPFGDHGLVYERIGEEAFFLRSFNPDDFRLGSELVAHQPGSIFVVEEEDLILK